MASNLTTSGLLYEGNFDEWLPRMRAILEHQHKCNMSCRDGQPPRLLWATNLVEKADTIWGQTSRYVRVRVPETSRGKPNALIIALHGVARPFRFGDLPPEIRSQIYSILMPRSDVSYILLPMEKGDRARQGYRDSLERSIFCISRQIRAGALPLHYRKQHFNIGWYDDDYPLNMARQTFSVSHGRRRVKRDPGVLGLVIANSINVWTSALRPDSLRSLRTITLTLVARPYMHLGCSLKMVNDKLELVCQDLDEWLSQGSLSILKEHAATVTGVAHTLKLEGEALMLFLTSRPEIWDRLPKLEDDHGKPLHVLELLWLTLADVLYRPLAQGGSHDEVSQVAEF